MTKNLMPYYLSRTVLSVAFAGLMYLTGSPLWMAALFGGLILILFILAPLSGRYSVHPEFGITALRRDERTGVINDKAARNAFVASMLAVAVIAGYFTAVGVGLVPVKILEFILVGGLLVYYISDFFLRRA
ncbi:MAG: hypothetical protein AB9891_10895 [Anaerolineaceae bacterium]